jgi:PleD family two-component response regulator
VSYQYNVGHEDADLLADLTVSEPELNVLFVGRDSAIADLYGRKLELDGYRMTLVTSDAQLHQRGYPKPDLIYLDLTTSKSWGHHILEDLRKDPATASTPVLLLVEPLPRRLPPLGPNNFLIPVTRMDDRQDLLGVSRYSRLNS